MKKEKTNEVVYTKKHFEILDYIYRNGSIAVEVAASTVSQNKNFYLRVQKLESRGLIKVIREAGMASLFSITPIGEKVYNALLQQRQMKNNVSNRNDFKIQLVKELIDELNIDIFTKESILKLLQ